MKAGQLQFIRSQRPPKRYVTKLGTILTALLFLSIGVLVIANIVGAWPMSVPTSVDVRFVDTLSTVTPAEIDSLEVRVARAALAMIRDSTEAGDTIRTYVFWRRIDTIGAPWDFRLLLIALWFGALGSLLHAGSSFVSFAGNRQLVVSWLPWYIVRPLLGAGLAAVFYVVMRAGFGTAGGAAPVDLSHYTVAASPLWSASSRIGDAQAEGCLRRALPTAGGRPARRWARPGRRHRRAQNHLVDSGCGAGWDGRGASRDRRGPCV